MSALLAYLWPASCPRCDARLNTLDRVMVQLQRLVTVAAWTRGQSAARRRDLRACSWCGKPNGSPKIRR